MFTVSFWFLGEWRPAKALTPCLKVHTTTAGQWGIGPRDSTPMLDSRQQAGNLVLKFSYIGQDNFPQLCMFVVSIIFYFMYYYIFSFVAAFCLVISMPMVIMSTCMSICYFYSVFVSSRLVFHLNCLFSFFVSMILLVIDLFVLVLEAC